MCNTMLRDESHRLERLQQLLVCWSVPLFLLLLAPWIVKDEGRESLTLIVFLSGMAVAWVGYHRFEGRKMIAMIILGASIMYVLCPLIIFMKFALA